MKVFIFVGLMILFCGSTVVADTDLEEQVRANQQRIEKLEEKIGILQEKQEYQESQLDTPAPDSRLVDPMIGKWTCSNSLYTYDINFGADGYLVQQGVVLGNSRTTTWTRVSESQIVIGGGTYDQQEFQMQPEFQSRDEFTVQFVESGTLWECKRIAQ